MSLSLIDLKAEQLTALLDQKRRLYDQMLVNNKKFEEVKNIFKEIKTLEKAVYDRLQTDRSILSNREKEDRHSS